MMCIGSVFAVGFKKAVKHAVGLIAGEGGQLNCMQGAEHVVFDFRIDLSQRADQFLDFLPLGGNSTVACAFGKTAGTLDEVQVIVSGPCENVIFADAVHGADQLHAGKVLTVRLGNQGIDLAGVHHRHQGCLDRIVEMMAEGDLVAAKFLCLVVEMTAAHPGAEIAGGFRLDVGNAEDVGFKNGDRDFEDRGILFDPFSVFRIVSGIHDEKHRFKGNLGDAGKLLEQLCHAHGILPAGNAYRDFISRLDQLIFCDRIEKRCPEFLAESAHNALFDFLNPAQFSCHNTLSCIRIKIYRTGEEMKIRMIPENRQRNQQLFSGK